MNTSANKYDSIEKLIFEEGIRIAAIDFHPEQDIILIVLNTKAILRLPLSVYPVLKIADQDKLKKYELTGGGVGVHWPLLDEDLSLKGFLREELKSVVTNNAA